MRCFSQVVSCTGKGNAWWSSQANLVHAVWHLVEGAYSKALKVYASFALLLDVAFP